MYFCYGLQQLAVLGGHLQVLTEAWLKRHIVGRLRSFIKQVGDCPVFSTPSTAVAEVLISVDLQIFVS
jgi:hypothetical protein